MTKELDTKVNNDWLTRQTGDPLADTGGWVIEWLWKQPEHQGKEIGQLIEYIAKHYVNDWGGKLHSFFLNSAITNAANKGREVSEVNRYFNGLINETEPNEMGYCRILGERTKLFSAGRHNSPLSGSTAFLNFHHGFQSGLMFSKEVLMRLFFLPYGSQVIGGLNAVLSANEPKIEQMYVYRICKENNRRRGSTSPEIGVYKSIFTNPANALFDFANQCRSYIREGETIEMNLLHYTNFAAKPESNLYCFSAKLFDFYWTIMQNTTQKDWKRFAHSFHRQKGATYDDVNDCYQVIEKKEKRTEGFEEFQKWYNLIYDKLLDEKPILSDFREWSRRQSKEKKKIQIFKIVEIYQLKIRGMKQETLNKVRKIAEYIVSDETKIKKRLRDLRNARNRADVRAYLVKLAHDKYVSQDANPILKLDEINILFPDGSYGQEISDLLLISVYEQLSEKQVFVEDEEDDTEEAASEE